jgi:hypothetical protein
VITALLATLLLAAPAPAAPKKSGPVKLAVLDVVLTGRDATGLDVAAMTELFGAAVEDHELFSTTTTRDVSAMLGLEKMKQMSGCTDDASCLVEIAGSLGVELLASAAIGSLEGRLVISARLIEVKRASVVARTSETVTSRGEAAEALQRVGQKLRNAYRASRGLPPVVDAAATAWSLGLWLGGVGAPTEKVAGGEALVTLGAGRWEFGAGMTVAEKPAARLAISRAIAGQSISLRLGLKGLAGSVAGGTVLGGGPAAWLRWRATSWLDADLVGSAEYLSAPAGGKLVPVIGVGLHGHLGL